MRHSDTPDAPAGVTRYTLRRLARRYRQPDTDVDELRAQMGTVRQPIGPALVARQGIIRSPLSRCWSRPVTTPSGCAVKASSRTCIG
jgi:hypothetical protein